MLREYVLPAAALGYVLRVLQTGKALANAVLECQEIADGNVTLFGPPGIDAARLLQFEVGGGLSRETSLQWLTEFVMQNLAANPEIDCVVFENTLASASDPWLLDAQSKLFFCGLDVYHYCSRGDDAAELETAIVEAEQLPYFWGTLSRLPSGRLTPRSQVDRDAVTALARETAFLIVGAYDGEGYLLWSPSDDARTLAP